MPTVPIPLREADDPVAVSLQAVFDRTFSEGRYERVVRYDQPCDPALPAAAAELLKASQRGH